MNTNGAPFSLTVSPVKQTYHGPTHITIKDSGTSALNVRTLVMSLHSTHAGCSTDPAKGVQVIPGLLALHPGQSETVTVTANSSVPSGDYGVAFQAVAGGKGAVHLTGAVGSQVLVRGANTPVCGHAAAVAPSPVSGGFPVLWLVVGLIALVLAVVGTAAWLRRRSA